MKKTKYGSFNDLLDITEEHLRPVLSILRRNILIIHPEAFEAVRMGDRAATYGLGPKKMIEGYAYIQPHKSWVNLGFFRGVSLEDKEKLLVGTGKKLRHIKIGTIEEADSMEVKKMIRLAVIERKIELGIN